MVDRMQLALDDQARCEGAVWAALRAAPAVQACHQQVHGALVTLHNCDGRLVQGMSLDPLWATLFWISIGLAGCIVLHAAVR